MSAVEEKAAVLFFEQLHNDGCDLARVTAGSVILKEGREGTALCIIQEGTVHINGKEYERPTEFGVNSAFANCPEVTAVSDVKILVLHKQAFAKFKEMKKVKNQLTDRSSPPNSPKVPTP
jgi:CRP-like cAMP-binding protein